MVNVLYIASNLLRLYAVCIFFNVIMGKSRFNHTLEIISFFSCAILNSTLFLIFDNRLITVLSNIIPLLIVSFQYKKSLAYKIFSLFSSYALSIAMESMAMFFIGGYYITNTVSAIFMLIAAFTLKHFIKDKNLLLKSNNIWLTIIISIASIAVVVLSIEYSDKLSIKTMITALIMLMVNFLNFYMYESDQKNLALQHTYKMIETSNKAYQNQLEIMNESQKKIRFLKHDMKNHIFAVKNLVSNNENAKAIKYIDEMTSQLYNSNEFVSTGNKDVDCLLNFKLSLAKEMGAEFNCDVSLPDSLAVTSFDMTTILGNLLDNSLNALKNAEEKLLDIKIKFNKGTLHINIENTYSPQSKPHHRDKSEHGLGLLSVEQALEKYHGVITKTQTDERFHISIFMYNSME